MSISDPLVISRPSSIPHEFLLRDARPANETELPASQASEVAQLVTKYGGPVSSGLLDPRLTLFRTPGIEGVIGYNAGWGCAVVMGDPVCAPEDMDKLADAFRAFCKEKRWHAVYACTGERFTQQAVARGCAAVEFGEELILDPRKDPAAGSKGRELRKKLNHAQRDGLSVVEYARPHGVYARLEREMEEVATAWLEARKGPQIYISNVHLFKDPEGKRWFYARQNDKVVGVLATVRLESREGHLLEHILTAPDAPTGTSESLIAGALKILGAEGCAFATFGPAPAAELGRVYGLGKTSEKLARKIFTWSGKTFHLDARVRYRRKFQVARTEPSSLVFDPAVVGPREILGVLRAFNVSVK